MAFTNPVTRAMAFLRVIYMRERGGSRDIATGHGYSPAALPTIPLRYSLASSEEYPLPEHDLPLVIKDI